LLKFLSCSKSLHRSGFYCQRRLGEEPAYINFEFIVLVQPINRNLVFCRNHLKLVFGTILFISRVFLTRFFMEWLEFSKVDKDRGCGGLKNHD